MKSTTHVSAQRVAFAKFIGITPKWYDFLLFGAAVTLIFGLRFFPTVCPTAGITASLAAFGVAFVARPIAGFLSEIFPAHIRYIGSSAPTRSEGW